MEKNKHLTNAFLWLGIGLAVCFVVAFLASASTATQQMVYLSFGGWGYLIFAIAEIVIALVLSFKIRTMSSMMAKVLYLSYAALTGLSLNGIFVVYTGSSLTFVFLLTAILFGSFALIGKYTKVDLSKWYVYLTIGLIAIIILEIVNIFLMNNTLNIFLAIVSVLLFCGYIAYDIRNLSDANYLYDCENKGIYIAFQLFIDIINIFLDLLRLFGRSDD